MNEEASVLPLLSTLTEVLFGLWTWMSLLVLRWCQPLYPVTSKLHLMNQFCQMLRLKVRTWVAIRDPVGCFLPMFEYDRQRSAGCQTTLNTFIFVKSRTWNMQTFYWSSNGHDQSKWFFLSVPLEIKFTHFLDWQWAKYYLQFKEMSFYFFYTSEDISWILRPFWAIAVLLNPNK